MANHDPALARAIDQAQRALADRNLQPDVSSWFDSISHTATHRVREPSGRHAAWIDPVAQFDPATGRLDFAPAEPLLAERTRLDLIVDWVLETHVHADHLSAGAWLRAQCGAKLGIGARIGEVQQHFSAVFSIDAQAEHLSQSFDHGFADGEQFSIGALPVTVLHVPGHTPACVAYLIGDALFVGDTLFMPDYGTARCDFPGGDARALFQSIQRLLQLPEQTRVFLCHDYKSEQRAEYCWQTSIGAERHNIHLQRYPDEAGFVAMREQRDQTLDAPRLLLPSVQFNLRGGRLPPADTNHRRFFKLPISCDASEW